MTFKPVEQDLLESPARPKCKTRTCSTRRCRTTTPSRRRAELALVRGAAGDADDLEPVSQPPPTTPAAASMSSPTSRSSRRAQLRDARAEGLSTRRSSNRPSRPEFAVGARVEARFEGGDKWYPGKFSRAARVVCDIRYEDGDEEDGCRPRCAQGRRACAEEPAAAAAGDERRATSSPASRTNWASTRSGHEPPAKASPRGPRIRRPTTT